MVHLDCQHIYLLISSTPNNGGPIITDGGVVFVAAATDNRLHAFDSKTGKSIWSAKLPAGGQATPMTYSIDGRAVCCYCCRWPLLYANTAR
ncbi:PQQ-binding-like beta-propeller repeat protein [Acinetobacter pittii]|uniref:PQQ-binding-like beta-propeller repeat protein n=1 Tax=Acinetobacter pittii TaxID=48296 RepID=UPI001FF3B9CE|nr:PQQ-binding-like beta-propeller repeat protein [Acinetobacter pittii]MCK0786580.1 PQQ-binding-like beta-propeller repeat protein [Acinetobacter pittii]